MNWIKQLFCNHSWVTLERSEDTFQEVTPSTEWWFRPVLRMRKKTTLLIACSKCGKTYVKNL